MDNGLVGDHGSRSGVWLEASLKDKAPALPEVGVAGQDGERAGARVVGPGKIRGRLGCGQIIDPAHVTQGQQGRV